LAGGTGVVMIVFLLLVVLPVKQEEEASRVPELAMGSVKSRFGGKGFYGGTTTAPVNGFTKIPRKGLFKPATPVSDNSMAGATIEKIKSQLKLQCLMAMNNEPVAYININGVGMRKCKVGDSVQDLFTVVGIAKTSVELMIVGHKVTLGL
jgi:hypothetical protein